MSVRRRGTKWYVDIDFVHPSGQHQRIRKSINGTRRDAQAWERRARAELAAGTYGQQKKEVPTLKEFSKEFLETYARTNNKPSEQRSKETHFRKHLRPALGPLKLDAITVRHVEHLKAELLGKGLKPKSVNNCLAVLNKMLRYAEEVELIQGVPRIRLLAAPLPDVDFLDFAEADRLLEAAEGTEWYPMVFFALRTGLRFGELVELRWGDLDLEAGRVVVRRSYYKGHVGTSKGGRTREVPLSARTVRLMRSHRQLKHLKGGLVFCQDGGDRIADSTADDTLKRLCRRAGLRKIGWHCCRHSFASHLVMRGAPLKTVQEFLGHTTITMTLRYSHLSPSVKREAVELLDESRHNSGTEKGNPAHVEGYRGK
jgi:integrase